MANITFIIGNGLDLSLGLKTSYLDFYEHVRQKKLHPENRIYKAIQEGMENWADFEKALGEYTNYIEKLPDKDRKKESIQFHEELQDFIDDLADYLEKQEHTLDDKINDYVVTNSGFYSGLTSGQTPMINQILAKGALNMRFVTLNYTSTLRKIVHNSHDRLRNAGIGVTNPHHIHGELIENLTLGVSDESQLSASLSGAEKDDLIKPSLIYSMNDGRIETLDHIIRTSSLIVLYGTSIGETDKYIWKKVTDWLDEATEHAVIIHKHDKLYTDTVRRSSRRQKQYISAVQERLLRFSGLDGDDIVILKNQIYVIHNASRVFAKR